MFCPWFISQPLPIFRSKSDLWMFFAVIFVSSTILLLQLNLINKAKQTYFATQSFLGKKKKQRCGEVGRGVAVCGDKKKNTRSNYLLSTLGQNCFWGRWDWVIRMATWHPSLYHQHWGCWEESDHPLPATKWAQDKSGFKHLIPLVGFSTFLVQQFDSATFSGRAENALLAKWRKMRERGRDRGSD